MHPRADILRSLTAIAAAGLAVVGCSTLEMFDTFVPKDGASARIAHDVAYGEGERRKLNVYAPKVVADGAGEGEAAPVILFIYGGSWRSGAKDLYDFAGRALAAQGYVTVIADYRLVPEVRFPAFVEDGAMAVKWIEDNIADYGGDAARLYLVGHSAGAYNAMMLAVEPAYLEAAGASPGIVGAVAGLSGPYDFHPFTSDAAIDAFQGTDNAATVTQPAALVGPQAPPMLLVTGTDDDTVNPDNVTDMERAARAAGVRVETAFYDGIDHAGTAAALSRPFRDSAPVLDDVVAFFRSVED